MKKSCKKEARRCRSELDCKATAALTDAVMKEMGNEDKPLKDLLENIDKEPNNASRNDQ
jgi:hypothetical protein